MKVSQRPGVARIAPVLPLTHARGLLISKRRREGEEEENRENRGDV